LFGHRSFREFLVARYWEWTLRIIIKASAGDWQRREAPLLGGRLLGREDRSLLFLLELLEIWQPSERTTLRQWAEQTFNDERISRSGSSDDALLYHDSRAYLREAALAIGSCVQGSTGIHVRNNNVLRSLLAWFWARKEQAIIRAPRLSHRGADLSQVILLEADLREADLRGSILSGASFHRSNFSGACLADASLDGFYIINGDLANADLSEADGTHLGFFDCKLDGVHFSGSHLVGSSFHRCSFKGTDFSRSDCTGSNWSFGTARSSEAVFDNADMTNARAIIDAYVPMQSGSIVEIIRAVELQCPSLAVSYEFTPMKVIEDRSQSMTNAIDVIDITLTFPLEFAERVMFALNQLSISITLRHEYRRS
jgi:uncharacterized protein YjbI with pentapeptide repeats